MKPQCMNCDKEMERIGGSSRNYFCRHCIVPEEKKPAREWWCVYDYNLRMHTMFESEIAAKLHYSIAKLDRVPPFLVREVVV